MVALSQVAAGLVRCAELIRHGEAAEAAALFQTLDPTGLTEEQEATRQAICLGILTSGNPETAVLLPLLDDIPDDNRPDLRYCALLMQRKAGKAAQFRRRMAGRVEPAMHVDWRWSLSLAALKRGHLRSGLALYPARFAAINRTEPVPSPDIDYVPMRERRLATVFLEQGLGDTVLHLAHLRALRGAEPLTILGMPRWGPVITRWFPGWDFRAIDPRGTGARIKANAAGDIMETAMQRGGMQSPIPIAPAHRADPARIGLIWRGGSRPNRPAERRMDLQTLLDLLPGDGRFLALQHDMTAEERALAARDPRIYLPAFDPVLDTETLIEAVSGLAGMLGVDGSAAHVAGCCGVPVCLLMNQTPHWYWGRQGRADALYPGGMTLSLAAPDRDRLRRWCRDRLRAHAGLAPAAPALPGAAARPVLIAGPPHGGGDRVLAALAGCGLWVGAAATAGSGGQHPLLGDRVMGRMLELFLGGSADGLDRLPGRVEGFAAPQLGRVVARALALDDFPGPVSWGLWDPRLVLTWPLWAAAFPGAIWVLCDPGRDAVAAAGAAGGLRDGAFWRLLHEAYAARAGALAASIPGGVLCVAPDPGGAVSPAALRALLRAVGLEPPARKH